MSQYRSSIRNLVTGAYTTAPYKENGEFTPFAALTYDLSPAWSAYASYAEIFQSQGSFFTASGERLKPMTGDNYELGLKGSLYGGKMNTSVALFRTMQEGRSQSDPNNPSPCAASPTGGACFIADGKVRSQGLDAEISGEVLPRWQVAAGYTFNTTKYLRDRTATGVPSANENQPLSTFTPRHMLRVWTGYQLPGELSAWTVGGGVNLQSTTYRTAGAIRLEQAGYAVWSARVAYRINRNVQAALNVANAFDKTYYRTLGSQNSGNWYGDPRNVTLTMQAFF